MKLLNPAGPVSRARKPLAPRRGDLAGRSLGLLDNSKPNAGALLERIAELLTARAGIGSVKTWRKPGSAQPAGFVDEIARSVDLVLTASAD